MRTEYCGNVTKEHLGKDVSICGWIHRRRDHGGVIFLDIRDLTRSRGLGDVYKRQMLMRMFD